MKNQNGQIYRKYIAQMAQTYNQREDIRVFIELLLTLISIFVFSVFAIRPTLRTIGGLTQEISGKRETIQTMDEKISNIQLAQQNYSASSDLLPFLLQSVPTIPEVATQLRQLELIAQSTGTKIVQINMQSIPLKESVSEDTENEKVVGYTIIFSGSFESILKTLRTLEDTRRGSLFSSSRISISDEVGNTDIVLTVAGEAPYYPQHLK